MFVITTLTILFVHNTRKKKFNWNKPWTPKLITTNELMGSNNQTTNLVFPNFFSVWKRKKSGFLDSRLVVYWTNKKLGFFSIAQTEKILGENCGKQDLLFGGLIPWAHYSFFRCLFYRFLSFFSEISWKVIIYFELRTSVVNCIEYGSWNKSMYCSSQTIIYDAFVSSIVHFKKFVIFALDNILKNTSQNWRNKKIANTSICSHW